MDPPKQPDSKRSKTQVIVAGLGQQSSDVRLCDGCRAIDFKQLLSPSDAGSMPSLIIKNWDPCRHIDPGDYTRHPERSVCTCCPLCFIFSKVAMCRYRDEHGNNLITPFYQIRSNPYAIGGYGMDDHCIQLNIEATHDWEDARIEQTFLKRESDLTLSESKTGALICRRVNDPPRILKPQLPTPDFDSEKAAFYISHCRKHHGIVCRPSGAVRNLRVIDCQESRVVPAPAPDIQYVALSYRWPPPSQIPSLPNLCTRSYPPVIHDAMLVTLKLGFRFLWVDMFCIKQDDEADKKEQIAQMDLVYNCAELTIIAAGSNHSLGLTGVSVPRVQNDVFERDGVIIHNTGPDPWYEVSSSKWNTRAWTFQEGLLSRRRLIFADHQTLFVCNRTFFCDSFKGLTPESTSDDLVVYTAAVSNLVDRQGFGAMAKLMTRHDAATHARLSSSIMMRNLKTVYRLLQDYTAREMTNHSDAIKAFLGIFNATMRTKGPVFDISGLPLILPDVKRDPEFSCRNQAFSISISWYREDLWETPQMRGGDGNNLFPSWSWAAWEGRVCFPSAAGNISKWVPFVRDFHLVEGHHESDTIMPIQELNSESVLPANQEQSLGFPIIQFSACLMAPGCFAFEDSTTWKGWSICGEPIRLGWRKIEGSRSQHERFFGDSMLEPFGCPSEVFWEELNSGEFSCIALGAVSPSSSGPRDLRAEFPDHFLVVSGDVDKGAQRVGYIITGAFQGDEEGDDLEFAQRDQDDAAEPSCSCTAKRWEDMTGMRTIRLV